jgi:hypothetical protein
MCSGDKEDFFTAKTAKVFRKDRKVPIAIGMKDKVFLCVLCADFACSAVNGFKFF